MVEYLEGVKSKVRATAGWWDAVDAFAVILGKVIETETALAAVDTCFKTYVFDTYFLISQYFGYTTQLLISHRGQ